MNITVVRLVIVATSTGFVVMCKILTVVVAFFLRSVYLAGHRLTVSGIFSRVLAVGCTGKACFGLAVGCTGKVRDSE